MTPEQIKILRVGERYLQEAETLLGEATEYASPETKALIKSALKRLTQANSAIIDAIPDQG